MARDYRNFVAAMRRRSGQRYDSEQLAIHGRTQPPAGSAW